MNFRKFPVNSTHQRRLRRVMVPFATTVAAQENLSQRHFDKELLGSRKALTPGLNIAPEDELVYLNQSDEAVLRQQAMDKAQQGEIEDAIALFTILIRYNPNSASNYNNRGLLYFQNGQLMRALADYNWALQLNPQLGKVYNNRANCFATLGELDSAIADYETAIDLDPIDIRARLNQGITFRELELYDQAVESFELALQVSQLLNSTDACGLSAAQEGHIYAERGRAYHLLGDWNCAVADYYRALTHLPFAGSPSDVSYRLRSQVRDWLKELLSPLQSL